MDKPQYTTRPKRLTSHSHQQRRDSQYESTREQKRPQEQKRQQNQQNNATSNMGLWCCAVGSTQDKHNPHNVGETSCLTPNLDFYQNKSCFKPNGLHIDELLAKWKNDYNTLEKNHFYISWLFPLQEAGRNIFAKPLTMNEIKSMREDRNVMRRFIESYKLMLGFYGIKLLDEKTGRVGRANNWEERFENLNNHSHNNLRITRILKCLGELDYEHFQAPLVRFFLVETLRNGQLQNVKRSVFEYFIFTVKDSERSNLMHTYYKPKDTILRRPVEYECDGRVPKTTRKENVIKL